VKICAGMTARVIFCIKDASFCMFSPHCHYNAAGEKLSICFNVLFGKLQQEINRTDNGHA
jgi:hypothetical protein